MKNKKKKILIVEDDETTCKIYQAMLMDYDINIAYSGEEAIVQIMVSKPDLIIMDLNLPSVNNQTMDGVEVLQRYKAKDEFFDIPAILVSAFAADPVLPIELFITYFKSIGFETYLPKPVSKNELLAAIDKVLKK